jgi:HK97 family phage major capsid protein
MKNKTDNTGILWVLSALALVAVAFFAFGNESSAFAGGAALASLPFFPFRVLMDQEPGALGGGALSQEQFQRTALGALEKVKGSQEELLKDVSRLDKETKSTLEDLTKIKNSFEGYDHQVKALEQAITKLNLQLTLEQRMAAGGTAMSFGQRLIRDKDQAKQAFGAICRLVGMPGLATKALGEDSSPGSTLINDDLSAEVYDSLLRFGAWSTLGVRPIGTKNTRIPVKTARPNANFILTEAGPIGDDTAKAGTTVTLEAEVVAVLLNVSLQLLEDGEIDVAADVLDDFIESVNQRCDFAAFAGNGTADGSNGGVTGLFSFATASVAAATRTTIATTRYDDWLRCLTSVDAAVLQRASRWWMHPSLMAAAMGVQDLNGRPIFQTALESPAGGVMNLFGFPVTMVGAAPSTNAANARVAVFGDPRAYAVGMRKQFTFEASDQARWTTLERSFRGHTRFDAVGARASALAAMTLPGA